MLSHFSEEHDMPQLELASIEIRVAEPKVGEHCEADRAFYADLWKNVCHVQAISTFVKLNLADVIGREWLTLGEIGENGHCFNKKVLAALCSTLVGIQILECREGKYALTDRGAMLQHADSNCTGALMETITSDDAFDAWAGLSTLVAAETETDTSDIEEDLLRLHATPIDVNMEEELLCSLRRLGISSMKGRVAYWGLQEMTDCLKRHSPDCECMMLDDITSFKQPVNVLILHRVMNLYGTSETIDACKRAIAPAGQILSLIHI